MTLCKLYSKGAYISGIRAFNHLPQSIKRLATDEASFKRALKKEVFISAFLLLYAGILSTQLALRM
jgi:hypothetical protein